MTETEKLAQIFFDLYNSGYRFVKPEYENNINYGLRRETEPGIHQVITFKGLKELAKSGKLYYDESSASCLTVTPNGMQVDEEFIDIYTNIIGFVVSIKK